MTAWNRIEFDDADLLQSYVENRQLVKDIAKRYGCTPPTVYRRLRELGVVRTNSEAHIGMRPTNYRGWYKDSGGYIYIQIPEASPYLDMITGNRYVREHRLVMAQHLGRCLKRWEVVHHKNRVKDDNRLENLILFPSQAEHNSVTILEEHIKELEQENAELRVAIKACHLGVTK